MVLYNTSAPHAAPAFVNLPLGKKQNTGENCPFEFILSLGTPVSVSGNRDACFSPSPRHSPTHGVSFRLQAVECAAAGARRPREQFVNKRPKTRWRYVLLCPQILGVCKGTFFFWQEVVGHQVQMESKGKSFAQARRRVHLGEQPPHASLQAQSPDLLELAEPNRLNRRSEKLSQVVSAVVDLTSTFAAHSAHSAQEGGEVPVSVSAGLLLPSRGSV